MLSNSGVRSAPMATSKASVPISWAFIIRALSPRRGQPVNAHTLHKVSAWGFHPFPQKNIFLMPEGIKPPLAGLREVRTQSSGKLGKADGGRGDGRLGGHELARERSCSSESSYCSPLPSTHVTGAHTHRH